MRIQFDIPDGTKAVVMCIIYDEAHWPEMKMTSMTLGTDQLQNRKTYYIPDKEGKNNEKE